ncbi:hypothetical protein AB0J03_15100 [Streptomyces microflavus]|uniref:hypothetical protein n=1 Tax=Streptomyces microflavus TaxID=1919 RepID=UPI0033E1189F
MCARGLGVPPYRPAGRRRQCQESDRPDLLPGHRPGFWEERGYHLIGDVRTGRRYAYEDDGTAPLPRN